MRKARINQRNKERNTHCVSLHTASSVSQHVLTRPSQACPLHQHEARALLGSSEWLGSSCHTQSLGHRGEYSLPMCWEAGLRKAGCRGGIRKTEEGYRRVTMATGSLASLSPPPNLASPHQLVGTHGAMTKCLFM